MASSSVLLRRLPSTTKHAAKTILANATEIPGSNVAVKRSVSSVAAAVQRVHSIPAADDRSSRIHNQFWGGGNGPTSSILRNNNALQMRSFAEAKTVTDKEENSEEEFETTIETNATTPEEKPSVLSTLPEGYSPGQAIFLLMQKGAGGAAIRRSEFHDLCLAARPGRRKDAGVIRQGLLDFKRTSSFLVDERGARLAMEGMMRSLMPTGRVFEDRRLMSALYVAEVFANEKTGLCFSAETKDVDVMLADLLQGVKDVNLKLDKKTDSDEEEEEKGEKDGEISTAERVVKTTQHIIYLLNRRAGPSEKKMKKRAARKYLKQLVCREGPSENTAHIATQICLSVGGVACARKNVVTPYRRRGYKTSEETNQLLEKATEEEEENAAAVAAVEEGAEEDGEEEKGEEEANDSDDKTEK